MTTADVPIWEKFCLTIDEAAKYTGIGENLIRSIIKSDRFADFVLWKGSHALIKRKQFEDYLSGLNCI